MTNQWLWTVVTNRVRAFNEVNHPSALTRRHFIGSGKKRERRKTKSDSLGPLLNIYCWEAMYVVGTISWLSSNTVKWYSQTAVESIESPGGYVVANIYL